jgi:hypothetical protein
MLTTERDYAARRDLFARWVVLQDWAEHIVFAVIHIVDS